MPSPRYTIGRDDIAAIRLAGFATVYMPETDDDPLTVRMVLRDTFGVFALAVLLAGVVCLTGFACLAFGA